MAFCSTVSNLSVVICMISIVAMMIGTTEETKGKLSGREKQEYLSCIEMKIHRCVKETGEMDLEIYACDNIHKVLNADQAELVCSTLGNCQDDYEKWKCFSNGYPAHCWQCLNSDFTSRIVRTQQRYKHYNGEIDSRGVPAQIHHSLKRMTIISLEIDLSVGLVIMLLARRLSNGKEYHSHNTLSLVGILYTTSL